MTISGYKLNFVYYNIITALSATIIQLKSFKTFKEEHAAKSAEERRHSNHNMRAHLGEYITTVTTKAAVSPITTNLHN
jgi:hypothetical protein